VVLGCALCEKHINVNQAFKLAFIDEEYQESYWGKDEEAMQKREGLKEELNSIAYYLELLEE
jgi:chaperone required for assembly of F1-ATPase